MAATTPGCPQTLRARILFCFFFSIILVEDFNLHLSESGKSTSREEMHDLGLFPGYVSSALRQLIPSAPSSSSVSSAENATGLPSFPSTLGVPTFLRSHLSTNARRTLRLFLYLSCKFCDPTARRRISAPSTRLNGRRRGPVSPANRRPSACSGTFWGRCLQDPTYSMSFQRNVRSLGADCQGEGWKEVFLAQPV